MHLKPGTRVLGFDDAPFAKGDESVPVVGVATRGSTYVEGVLRTDIWVDGDDAAHRLAEAVRASRFRHNTQAVLTQNVMMGGFNVLDLDRLHEATGIPVLAVSRGEPDLDAQRAALLSGKVPQGEAKWQRIEALRDRMVPLRGGKLTVVPVGLPEHDARRIVEMTTVRGWMPEPLRLAHLIAAGWVLGESRGQ